MSTLMLHAITGYCTCIILFKWALILVRCLFKGSTYPFTIIGRKSGQTEKWRKHRSSYFLTNKWKKNIIHLNPAMLNSVISNRIGFPLDLPLFYQSFTMDYLELGYLEHPAISNCFSLPLVHINPGYLELYYSPNPTLVNISQEVQSTGTSWQDVWKLRNVLACSR